MQTTFTVKPPRRGGGSAAYSLLIKVCRLEYINSLVVYFFVTV